MAFAPASIVSRMVSSVGPPVAIIEALYRTHLLSS